MGPGFVVLRSDENRVRSSVHCKYVLRPTSSDMSPEWEFSKLLLSRVVHVAKEDKMRSVIR